MSILFAAHCWSGHHPGSIQFRSQEECSVSGPPSHTKRVRGLDMAQVGEVRGEDKGQCLISPHSFGGSVFHKMEEDAGLLSSYYSFWGALRASI